VNLRRLWIVLAANCLLLTACQLAPARALTGVDTVRSYFSAVARRDWSALTAYTTPDIEWYSVADGQHALESSGREALVQLLQQFFAREPGTQWSIDSELSTGDYIAVSERARGEQGGRRSLGIYQLQDGRIRRITYFLN
jgi:ketosteroid isomerase-like protein